MDDVLGMTFGLSALESQAGRLNELSDEINKKLAAIQSRIVAMNIGMEFWYDVPIWRRNAVVTSIGDGKSTEIVDLLGLTKQGGQWCLAVKAVKVEKGFYEGNRDCPYENRYFAGEFDTPILESSRELRIAALGIMKDFISELALRVKAANEVIERKNVF
jgi:hypothetical protein